jgi:hypothetical protein
MGLILQWISLFRKLMACVEAQAFDSLIELQPMPSDLSVGPIITYSFGLSDRRPTLSLNL